MQALSRDNLELLSRPAEGWHISLYMPTVRSGPGTEQGPIRFQNLLRDAERRLITLGVRPPEAKKFIAPLESMRLDGAIWRYPSDGLAVFLAPHTFQTYRVPLTLPELVDVRRHFTLKPLLPLLTENGRFFVLALSQNRIRLLLGSQHSMEEIELPDAPQGLAEALRYDELEIERQLHTVPSGPVGRGSPIYHGQGVGSDIVKDRLLRYCRQVETVIGEHLKGEHAPLIFAGVDYLSPIYRTVNHYPHLLDEIMPGNPDDLSQMELHAKAWAVVEPRVHQARTEAKTRYQALLGTGQTSNRIDEILPAADHGRVETLFAREDAIQWGIYDPAVGMTTLHPAEEPGDEDLVDLAAVRTFLNNGAVYLVTPDEMPDTAPVVAVFRY